MSITYEQALGTLTSMFTAPWTEDSLDTVLRHFEGHMENTVDAVLTHGDADPQLLIQRLQSGTNQEEMDEQLARELANNTQQQHVSSNNHTNGNGSAAAANQGRVAEAATATPPWKKGRGNLTVLPDDFLRIPGNNGISNDEALARMLQDKLFADEIRNNPEFAHLARGRGGIHRSRMNQQQHEGPNIMEALGSMGESAKKRLQELAVKVKNNINSIDQANMRRNNGPFGSNGVAERRGLLDIGEDDDDEQEISFIGSQRKTDYEMRDFDKKRD
mmetsp:Transcript_18990/g.28446  ORF Transcript_18990/g.28446 Transcript_18990/m.28446 type:complete len:274 (+) Transcript_18990:144-965(+)|eukprot:CAMPEP_0203644542 /NCGR_PEP_ID=MMETSP0088-20131115/9976_1 /ASSEMBLY_ACC=CAM_ASM_001087 /TAXON_ID=426623 /ORGANISM="Chaetoceros affinis, Strain CCMP159" /LENGTH=273 /DNA_ID=CAMNT_0050501111 /DNA_START=34 /DNA_END=855 /DNA_ORIENTATION=-